MKKIFNLLFATSLALGFVACSDDDDSPATGDLTLNLSGLEELGDDYVYEGWVIVDGEPVTTGRFTDIAFPQTFDVAQEDLDAATAFVLSIEPSVGDDPAPADTKLLIGAFSGDTANVTSNGIVTVEGEDFSDSSGKYILATPTDGGDMTDEYSGIWFLDNSGTENVAGLTLPTLAAGWAYEGWVVIDGEVFSTGTFLSATGADDNANTPLYSTGGGPGYPGEDFLTGNDLFPTDLRGGVAVISVEPVPDNSAAPFTLKPLASVIPADAMVHTTITMGTDGPVTAELTGTVTK